MIARGLSIAAGALILATVAHVTVLYTGGYGNPHAFLTLGVAFGVAVGSVCCGKAHARGATILAVAFAVCIVCGEAYNFLQSANRLMAATEAAQAPKREHAKAVSDAAERVRTAEQGAGTFTTSPRLTAALAAQRLAAQAVVEKSAERGCRENCRQLLQQAVDDAATEVTKARTALEGERQAAETKLRQLKAAHDAMAAPESPSPFADRIGMAPWLFDVIVAALGSMAINGLACCLMVFGSHTAHRPQAATTQPETQPVAKPSPATAPNVVKVLADIVQPAGLRQRVEIEDLLSAYAEACKQRGADAASLESFGAQAKAFADAAGIRVLSSGGKVFWCGVQLSGSKDRSAAKLGRMTKTKA